MGQSYNSGNTSVNGTVTAIGTFTETSYTVTSATAERLGVASGTTAIFTVPANHQYKILKIELDTCLTGATARTRVEINGGRLLCKHITSSATQMHANTVLDSTPNAPLCIATAGQVLNLVTEGAANPDALAIVYYIDEAV